ncbi:hypothetical protein CJ671_10510 [Aliarcobacter cryaerophilus]|uniref:Uncharacterized protein n=1 Tax=Aliarcobacter cryaerophilus TaxID=28198 RepID=A0A2S9SJY5_9BACT|nr:hypothetical protein [Aliarcobacter cryaerophilus]PRM86890.1 hypothetical protein CJ671_10510 [Aliarcobacter cryaerophilus]
MSTFIRLLPGLIGLVIGTVLYVQDERLTLRTLELATANETITTLQSANDQMATEFKTLQREEIGLRTLLAHQNAALTELDQQQRKTADDLQHALATPPAGRPDCAREPLPVGALRLLQPAKGRGANTGGETPATAGAGAPLPGT